MLGKTHYHPWRGLRKSKCHFDFLRNLFRHLWLKPLSLFKSQSVARSHTIWSHHFLDQRPKSNRIVYFPKFSSDYVHTPMLSLQFSPSFSLSLFLLPSTPQPQFFLQKRYKILCFTTTPPPSGPNRILQNSFHFPPLTARTLPENLGGNFFPDHTSPVHPFTKAVLKIGLSGDDIVLRKQRIILVILF